MMMEEEIERTKEEIKGIEEACEKVEQVLEKVIQSQGLNGHVELLEGAGEQEEETKMEEIIQDAEVTEELNHARVGSLRSDWFEDENLLSLWNGSDSS